MLSSGSRPRPRALALFVAVLVAVVGCGTDEVAEPEAVPEERQVHQFEVFFTNTEMGEIGEVFPVDRETTADDLPLAALTELLAGPTAEEEAEGYSSWFSDEPAELLTSVRVDDEVALVDFDASLPEVIPGASSSAGATALWAELDTTLYQFTEIADTRYSLAGDVAAFYEWLQLTPPDHEGTPPHEPDAAPDDPAVTEAAVRVYFTNPERGADDEVFPVERIVETPAVLHGALEALLEGPTAEEKAEGYSSWFSPETAGLLNSVRIEGGVAFVDFDASLRDAIPGASSSAGSAVLLAELDATATQFPTVDDVRYALDGDDEAFYNWLQRSAPD